MVEGVFQRVDSWAQFSNNLALIDSEYRSGRAVVTMAKHAYLSCRNATIYNDALRRNTSLAMVPVSDFDAMRALTDASTPRAKNVAIGIEVPSPFVRSGCAPW
jgi:hypothetical protein